MDRLVIEKLHAEFQHRLPLKSSEIETLSEAPASRQSLVHARGLFVDYPIDSRRRLVPSNVPVLSPNGLSRLTQPIVPAQTPDSAGLQASAAAAKNTPDAQ
jgi:hypothetical protein